jgi:hypothetical protein
VIFREELALRLFGNMVLKRIFGSKRRDVIEGWRKPHNEELHDLYPSPSIIRIIKSGRMGLVRHVARIGEKRKVYRFIAGKQDVKRQLGKPRRRWVDNIILDFIVIE